jgi:hypothetical protein
VSLLLFRPTGEPTNERPRYGLTVHDGETFAVVDTEVSRQRRESAEGASQELNRTTGKEAYGQVLDGRVGFLRVRRCL